MARFVLPLILLSACAGEVDDGLISDVAARSPLDGTPEGIAVLAFLNDGHTATFAVLDVDVPLDQRAARNLAAHRDGKDGVVGTRDDDFYGGIDEVDAVSYVGPSAMQALFDYVAAQGLVPSGSDALGTWDGVSFTVDEADATVALANSATLQQLDVDFGLDKRAADSIVAARPLETVLQLSDLYYVGNSALTALKTEATIDSEEPAACDGTSFTAAADADASAFSDLVEIATMGDWPWSHVSAYDTCPAWIGDATVDHQIWDATFDISFADAGGIARIGDWQTGGGRFPTLVRESVDVIDERVESERFDPNADSNAAALYAARHTLADALIADMESNPDAWRSLGMSTDAEECSEEASAVVDLRDGRMLIIRRFPRC